MKRQSIQSGPRPTDGHSWAWLAVLMIGASLCSAAEFHVRPDGKAEHDGSAERAWDLPTALTGAKGKVKPGDTILLHEGTYRGSFASSLRGTAEKPIAVRAAPGQGVVIDLVPGKPGEQPMLAVDGAHAIYQGFTVTSSDPRRATTRPGSHPEDIQRGVINATGSHLKFVNLIVHDLSQGFGAWSGGEGGEIYGCIIYNNGWTAPDRGHGHGIYAQNDKGTKRFVDNVIFNQFGYGIHVYGSERASLKGFHIEGNVLFGNGSLNGPDRRTPAILIGGGSAASGIKVLNNHTFGEIQLGYSPTPMNEDIALRGNYFAGPVRFRNWQRTEFVGNTVIAPGTLVRWEVRNVMSIRLAQWEDNSYVRTESDAKPFVAKILQNTLEMSFGEWQTRFEKDANGRYAGGRPRGARVALRQNQYETGRAHLVVHNPERRESVEVDFTGFLRTGQRFEIRSVQNLAAEPVLAGVYDGRPIALPMKATKPAAPVGLADAAVPITEPELGVYLVRAR